MAVRLHVKVCEAHDLIAADIGGKSDPYCKLKLKSFGKKDKALKTKTIKETLDPVWNQEFDLTSKSPADDVLLISVYDKDKLGKDDKIADEIELPLSNYPLGEVKVEEISLKRKKKKKAGTLKLEIQVFNEGDAPAAAPAEEKVQETNEPVPCQLRVLLVSASKLKKMDPVGKSDPYCVFQLDGFPKEDAFYWKSSTKDNTLDPVWNEEHVFQVRDYNKDVLVFKMFDKDIASDDQMVDDVKFHVNQFPMGQEVEWSEDVKYKKKKGGHLVIKFQVLEANAEVKTRDIVLDTSSHSSKSNSHSHSHKSCSFTLGSYSSSYSTSFSSYTCSHTLSSLHSSEKKLHVHHELKAPSKSAKPVRVSDSISGTIVSCRDLPKADSDGTDAYVTISVVSKSAHEKKGKAAIKTEVAKDTQDPVYNHSFEIEKAKKGDSLLVKVVQQHKILSDVCIGQVTVPLKDLKDNEPVEQEYELQKPPKLPKELAQFVDFGKITLSLTHSVKYQ
ncbi:hypothetical protein TRFO_32557 [Tritrichomonas foetus]|uniref:C2 domain-containing protein n=1 Tax=Tritrichomonas foetus TaxID=1144522 RepID=A0A1J4JTT9_9EUKA|nr:hypothetical protein [Tritrichomonas foetus]OHT00693.1 hypothetical protein TRFO_32557 [Tritrichomonas foetus]|eukprot:OHT00693.1 hypothetical protein TRFO_32557 [Tritrichomonas foetus]